MIKQIVSALILLILSTHLFSQSYAGGEISVEKLANGEFEFTVIYVQNCLSCSEGATCNIPTKLIASGNNNTIQVDLKVETVNSTPLTKCRHCTRCTNDTCDVNYGYSDYKLMGRANLSTLINNSDCAIEAMIYAGAIDTGLANIKTSKRSVLMKTAFNACENNSTPSRSITSTSA